MGDDYEMIISVKFDNVPKAEIKAWAEVMTLWDLYELSKTDPTFQFTLYKKKKTMVEEVEATAESME